MAVELICASLSKLRMNHNHNGVFLLLLIGLQLLSAIKARTMRVKLVQAWTRTHGTPCFEVTILRGRGSQGNPHRTNEWFGRFHDDDWETWNKYPEALKACAHKVGVKDGQ